MKRIILILVLGLLSLTAGCKHIAGPRDARSKPPVDEPGLSIEERERRARDKYPTFEDDWRVAPAAYNDRPSPVGR